MARIKITATVTNDLTYDQRMIRICSSLQQAGYDVTLVGRQRPNSQALQKQPFTQKRLPCFFQKGKLFYVEYNIRLFFWLLFQKTDIINSIDLDTILPGFLVSRLRGKICVYDAHEYYTETPEVVRRPVIQRVWEMVARSCIPRLQYAYTVGPVLARLFEERYGTPFSVVRNLPWRRLPETVVQQPDKAVILYQGALNEGRGLETAIEAMLKIDNAELWLAGEGDCSAALRTQAKALNLEHKVRFLGYILPDQLPMITAQAKIGLNLLENKGLSYYYSLANKAFDYLQAMVPAVHMDFPEYRALQEQYGGVLLLSALSAEELAALLSNILSDTKEYRKLQQSCQLAAKDLNWENEQQQLLTFYARLSIAKK